MRFTVELASDGRHYLLTDQETGATWSYDEETSAHRDKARAEKDPRWLRQRTAAREA